MRPRPVTNYLQILRRVTYRVFLSVCLPSKNAYKKNDGNVYSKRMRLESVLARHAKVYHELPWLYCSTNGRYSKLSHAYGIHNFHCYLFYIGPIMLICKQ